MNRAQAKRYKLHGSNARIIRGPSRDEVLGRLQTLPRGDGVLILEDLDHPHRYVQVLLQGDGFLRLEVRDDDPVRHLMTRSLSVERVADAFDGWMTEVHEPSRTGWRDAFRWHDISNELLGPGSSEH
nr:Unknown Function [uncultured bacterium]